MNETQVNGWITTKENKALPCPAQGSSGLTISTLIDSGKNANGNFIATTIGEDKLQYQISYTYLTPEQFKEFLAIFDKDANGYFVQEFTVYDPRKDEFVTIPMYAGDRGGRPIGLDENFKPTGWADVQITLTQI